MNLDVLPPALQLVVLLLGTVAVPLLIYLFSRRAQLRQLNTTSDATLVTASATLVKSLQTQIEVLDAKIARLEQEQRIDRGGFVAELTRARDEILRLSGTVVALRTDLDIACRQLTELEDRGGKSRAPERDM